VIRRRLRVSCGFAVVSSIEQNSAVEKVAIEVATWLSRSGGLGTFNVQFLEEHGGATDGSIWLSDLNPRPGTSSVSALASGSNLVAHLIGERVSKPQCGLVVRNLQDHFYPDLLKCAKGIVLDLDETVICQKSWMAAKSDIVSSKLNERFGAKIASRFNDVVMSLIDEGPWDRMLDFVVSRADLQPSMIDYILAEWRSAQPKSVAVHPDAAALITALKACGIPLALVTDNPVESQKQKLAVLPKGLYPDVVTYTAGLQAPKPSPIGFIDAAARLGLSPSDLIMVGDSPWRDASGSLAAGYRACVLVQRKGSMTNANSALFLKQKPDISSKVIWLENLFGLQTFFCGMDSRS
jgi:FMN phosphatase YigB (HAD superfamily)